MPEFIVTAKIPQVFEYKVTAENSAEAERIVTMDDPKSFNDYDEEWHITSVKLVEEES